MARDELFSGESKNIEYKVTVPDKSEKYMKTVVAFANFHFQKRNAQYLREKIGQSFWTSVNIQDRYTSRLKVQ